MDERKYMLKINTQSLSAYLSLVSKPQYQKYVQYWASAPYYTKFEITDAVGNKKDIYVESFRLHEFSSLMLLQTSLGLSKPTNYKVLTREQWMAMSLEEKEFCVRGGHIWLEHNYQDGVIPGSGLWFEMNCNVNDLLANGVLGIFRVYMAV